MTLFDVQEGTDNGRKKTDVRTVRVPLEISKELELAAAEDGVSYNSLLTSVLIDYATWARKAKKFGFTFVSKNFLRILLQTADSKELDRLVRERYGGILRDMAMFWFQGTTVESIVKVLELLSQHNWNIDLVKRVDGRRVTLSFHYDLGPKFSVFLKAMLDTTFRNEFHLSPTYDEGDSSLTVRFSVP